MIKPSTATVMLKIILFAVWMSLSVHYWQILGQYFQNPAWHQYYISDVTIIETWFLLTILVATWIIISLTKDLETKVIK